MTNSQAIAQAVVSQISRNTRWALGFEKMQALGENDKRMGGLFAKASLAGRRKCEVKIELTWGDVYVVTVSRVSGTVIGMQSDVYCEDLECVVTNLVEAHFAG
jgi:hypothetical protein